MSANNPVTGENAPRRARGFQLLSKEQHSEIARLGGQAALASGKAHCFTHEETVRGGAAGGKKVSENREHMRLIGRKGGKARHSSAKPPTKEEDASRPGVQA